MSAAELPWERRRGPRVEVVATAIVRSEKGYAGFYLVENLSESGALFVGDPRLSPGERVEVLLHLSGRSPFSLVAEVIRQSHNGEGECVFAVAFRGAPARAVEEIQRVVLEVLHQHRPMPRPALLSVEDPPEE